MKLKPWTVIGTGFSQQ